MQTEFPQKTEKSSAGSEPHVGWFVLAVLTMVVMMIWSIYSKGPSGQSLDTKGFILFWLRELIVLACVAIALVIAGIGSIRRRIQQHRGGEHVP